MTDRNLINSSSERIKSKASGRSKKFLQRASYIAVFILVLTLVATSYTHADSITQVSLPGVSTSNSIDVNILQGQKVGQVNQSNAVATSLSDNTGGQLAGGAVTTGSTTADDVKSANIASAVASVTNLSSSNSVSSNAESVNVSAEMAQADATSVSKQQIVAPTTESKALATYVVKEGDSAETIAKAHGVSAQTIRWANGLKTDAMAVGSTITIPAVDGVVYTVKEGDDLKALADKYKSSTESITNINNLNSDKVATGTAILLPDGVLPEEERPEYVAPRARRRYGRSSYSYGYNDDSSGVSTTLGLYVPIVSGNRYAYGYCTWYAYNRRVQLGLPVSGGWGNANTWDSGARASGLLVDHIPSVGAIFQTKSGYYGHVGIVERVNPDGSVFVSEMNYAGWNVRSTRTIHNLAGYKFIH